VPQEQTGPGRHRVESKRQSVLRSLKTMSSLQHIRPELLHRVRIDLRRLEAWLDLAAKSRMAETLNLRLSPLSPLRTLHLLEAWLVRRKAPLADIRKVCTATRQPIRQLAQDRVIGSIREAADTVGRLVRDPDSSRQRKIWQQHRAYMTRLLATLRHKPKQKRAA
jgi:hypothetical protein